MPFKPQLYYSTAFLPAATAGPPWTCFPTCKVGITESILSSGGEDLNWFIHDKFLEVSDTKYHKQQPDGRPSFNFLGLHKPLRG